MQVYAFAFNPFQENTYIIWDETLECAIIDPGCYQPNEQEMLQKFIADKNLKPVLLLQTHAHLDHVFGTAFVNRTWKLKPLLHAKEATVYETAEKVGLSYGVPMEKLPMASFEIKEGTNITFGKTELEVFFTPGHSPGSVCFYHAPSKNIIVGDVLFNGSIGRTDLPGGHHQTLIDSINNELMLLPDDTIVYSGHGSKTTIGHERQYNPFLND
jgi:hydroxyacylglutathione hydrolase